MKTNQNETPTHSIRGRGWSHLNTTTEDTRKNRHRNQHGTTIEGLTGSEPNQGRERLGKSKMEGVIDRSRHRKGETHKPRKWRDFFFYFFFFFFMIKRQTTQTEDQIREKREAGVNWWEWQRPKTERRERVDLQNERWESSIEGERDKQYLFWSKSIYNNTLQFLSQNIIFYFTIHLKF